MEKKENYQPRESLDEKPSLLEERSNTEGLQDNPETLPNNGDTPTKDESPNDLTPAEKEWEYVTGLKLLLAIIAVTLAAFLMLLDNSIIATVSTHSIARVLLNSYQRPFRGSRQTSNLSTTSVGMEVPTSSLGEFFSCCNLEEVLILLNTVALYSHWLERFTISSARRPVIRPTHIFLLIHVNKPIVLLRGFHGNIRTWLTSLWRRSIFQNADCCEGCCWYGRSWNPKWSYDDHFKLCSIGETRRYENALTTWY